MTLTDEQRGLWERLKDSVAACDLTNDAASLITSMGEEIEEAKSLLRLARGYARQLPIESLGGTGCISAYESDMHSFKAFLSSNGGPDE